MASSVHEFSPITTEVRLNEAMEYIAVNSLALARAVLGKDLGIDTICLFAQSKEEYEFILKAVLSKGTESGFSHAPTTYVDTNLHVAGQSIQLLGVRQPDVARPWVGYADYPLTPAAYNAIKTSGNQYIKEIVSGRDEPLLEFKHEDFDVLGYAVKL